MRKHKSLKLENEEICALCGGKCCKNGGCKYLSQDFAQIKLDYIESVLDQGNISVAALIDFRHQSKKTFANITLYLRERDINHDAIDLVSVRSCCSSLKNNRCEHDISNRPSVGATLVPSFPEKCHPSISHEEFIANWEPHQEVLHQIVEIKTGKTVLDKLEEDVEELFYKLYSKQIDEYDSEHSVKDMIGMLKDFEALYPEAAKKGIERSNQNVPMGLLRNYRK